MGHWESIADGKFVAISADPENQERSQINNASLYLVEREKGQTESKASRWKELINRTEGHLGGSVGYTSDS